MFDPIGQILNTLRSDRRVQQTRFNRTFLHNAGTVLEVHGFGAAKVFLLDRFERPDQRQQAETLLNVVLPVLERSEVVRQKRALGRTIIKSLNAIKAREV